MNKEELIRFIGNISYHSKNGCWVWNTLNQDGYGKFRCEGKTKSAHIVSYQHFYDDYNRELTIDHQCNNRGCVNPLHLLQMSQRENTLRNNSPVSLNSRKLECKNGHPFSGHNVSFYTQKNSEFRRRACKKCMIAYRVKYYLEKNGRNRKRRLTIDQVMEIRKLYAEGKHTYKELRKIYNVVESQIGAIVNKTRWDLESPSRTGRWPRTKQVVAI